ncbi:hypothetical protein GTS_56270 [Gandjariella thermophila]|uniref:Uncharacterized protein n=1 Tax=Gandjariella thermophila TaxID=1931992 RepID=A0A4D4JEB5_9PSEU|nr:hypothetical protein GTS_56270 [Gandjariella thermophila]
MVLLWAKTTMPSRSFQIMYPGNPYRIVMPGVIPAQAGTPAGTGSAKGGEYRPYGHWSWKDKPAASGFGGLRPGESAAPRVFYRPWFMGSTARLTPPSSPSTPQPTDNPQVCSGMGGCCCQVGHHQRRRIRRGHPHRG